MIIDFQLLHMVASVTACWPVSAADIENYCREEWLHRGILDYMSREFVHSKIPITMRFYELDDKNQDLLVRALRHLGRNLCPCAKSVDVENT